MQIDLLYSLWHDFVTFLLNVSKKAFFDAKALTLNWKAIKAKSVSGEYLKKPKLESQQSYPLIGLDNLLFLL